jgi:hypothetical protein
VCMSVGITLAGSVPATGPLPPLRRSRLKAREKAPSPPVRTCPLRATPAPLGPVPMFSLIYGFYEFLFRQARHLK